MIRKIRWVESKLLSTEGTLHVFKLITKLSGIYKIFIRFKDIWMEGSSLPMQPMDYGGGSVQCRSAFYIIGESFHRTSIKTEQHIKNMQKGLSYKILCRKVFVYNIFR